MASISKRYLVKKNENNFNYKELLEKVDVVPASLIFAQSANESAWGTSRFARGANNYFGQWCYSKGCGLVPSKREKNKIHEVKKFDSPYCSVVSYVHNLNTSINYKKLRFLRMNLRQAHKKIAGLVLVNGLDRYSERGQKYIKDIRSMIITNKLSIYDALYG